MDAPQTRPAFVGRAGELARLDAALAEASAGRPRVVLIAGEAGVGKTRLLEQATDRWRGRDLLVLEGACLPGPAAPPYAPVVEILRSLRRAVEPGALAAILGPGRRFITRLVPDLADRSTDLDAQLDPASQVLVFELVAGALERLASRAPLVVVVEDVQWADASSRGLLDFIARGARPGERLLVLATIRSDDLGNDAPARVWAAELMRLPIVERIDLGPLPRSDVATLVGDILGRVPDAGVVAGIMDRTSGNPFLAEELAAAIDHGERQLPGHLREILLARLAPLAEPSRDVMRAAAASGRRVDDELLAEVLDRPPDDVDEALRDGLAHGVLVSDPGTGELRFRHALVRDAVDGELLPGERRRLHQAFATALEGRRSAGGATARPEELAFHWEAAGRRDRAALAELDAARAAAAVSAWAEASRRYQRALALDGEVGPVLPTAEMPEILLEAANAASLAGDYEVAAGLARRAVPLVDPDADPARAAVVHQSLRWFLWEAGDLDAAAAEVAEALRLTPATPPSALRARAVAHAAGLAMSRGDPVEALRLAEEAIAIGRDAGARAEEALGLGIAGWAHATSGDVDESTRLFEEGMAIARSLGSAEGVALGYSNLTAVLDRAGRTDEALDLAAAGFAEVERLGLARSFGVPLLAAAARMRFHQGRWAEADELLERARSLAPMPAGQVAIELLFARLAAARGRFDRADAALDIAVRAETAASFRRTPSSTDGALDPASSSPAALHAIIEVAAWRSLAGDTSALAAARVVEDAALQRTLGAPLPDPSLAWVAALGLRVEADAAVGATYRREEHARSEALGRVAMLGQWLEAGRPALAGDLDRAASVDPRIGVMARQCLAEGDRAQGRASLSAWEEVAAGWERLGRPLPVAYARFRAAESGIGSADDRVAARAALIAAHAAAARLGAEPLRLEAERLARLARVDLVPATEAPALRASSSPPASGQARPTDETLGLTPRELEVLRLVAEGWSNPEIAAGLGISAKTASVHVSNVLDKLGVPNRVEAAVAAIRLGLARGQAGDDGDEHADDMGGLRAGGNAGSAGGAAAVASVRRTFMFTDIVGSTQLAEAIGDGAWHDLLRWHDATLRREFERHAGREVDHAGDGFLVVFRSPRDAVACAVAIQRALAAHRASAGFALAIRIGLHEGEAVERDGRFVGATVHLAARIAARAEGGTILGSATTLRSAGAHPDGSAVEVRLAGISSPVAVARVGW